jgi:hypothetical protein
MSAGEATIDNLLAIINDNVKLLKSVCRENGTQIPDLQSPFHPASEAFRGDPQAAEAINLVVAAAGHLSAILAPPPVSLYHAVGGVSPFLRMTLTTINKYSCSPRNPLLLGFALNQTLQRFFVKLGPRYGRFLLGSILLSR